MKKKILIFERSDSNDHPGGDRVQIQAMAKFLMNHGFEVQISNDYLLDLNGYDWVFVLNLTRPFDVYLQTRIAIQHKVPYILFPVYWNLDELEMDEGKSLTTWIKKRLPNGLLNILRAGKFINNNIPFIKRLAISPFRLLSVNSIIRESIRSATYICPNSQAELQHLINYYDEPSLKCKSKVIYNGVCTRELLITNNPLSVNIELPEVPYLCCVGAIGPRKNQLNLVKAANLTGIPLVIIGRAAPQCMAYFKKIKRIAGKHIYFFDHLPQQTVFEIMKRSAGHVQPSYIETPGLSSLEAAALGCTIGVSDVPPVREYFKEMAHYCDPRDVDSIAGCLSEMLVQPASCVLKDSIVNSYSWDVVLVPLINCLE